MTTKTKRITAIALMILGVIVIILSGIKLVKTNEKWEKDEAILNQQIQRDSLKQDSIFRHEADSLTEAQMERNGN